MKKIGCVRFRTSALHQRAFVCAFEKFLDQLILPEISIPFETAIHKIKSAGKMKIDPIQLAKELPTHLLLESALVKSN